MKYQLQNEQLLLLAALLNKEEIVGIENSLSEKTPEQIVAAWKAQEPTLLKSKILYYDENNKLKLYTDISEMLQVLFEPQYVLIVEDAVEQDQISYFYIKKNQGIYMTNDKNCTIEFIEDFPIFKERLIQVLELKSIVNDSAYLLKLDAENLNTYLEATYKGDIEKVIPDFKMHGLVKEEAYQLLTALINEEGKTIRAIKFEEEIAIAHTSIKIHTNECANWLLKQRLDDKYDRVTLYKGNAEEVIKILFCF